MPSARKLIRRRIVSRSVGGRVRLATSAWPSAIVIICSWASAPSSSVTNSGFPAAPAIPASSRRPGAAPTASATSSATARPSSPRRDRRRPPAASRPLASRSRSATAGAGRKHPMIAAGRPSSRAASAPRVTRLDGSAQCRSSAPITSGPSSASSSARSANASTARNCRPGSLVTVTGPVPPALEVPAVPAGQQLPDRGPPRIRRRPGAAEHPGDQPERPGPLQLGRPGRRHPQAAAPRLLQRVLEQPRLADAGLAVDQHDGQAPGRRPVDGVVQDRGLGLTTADTRVRGRRVRRAARRADAQVPVRSRAHLPLGAPTEEGTR